MVVQKNAGHMHYQAPGLPGDAALDMSLACDAVMIAGLVDHGAKASIAARFKRAPNAPALLIMRSATGLSTKRAYDPVLIEAFGSGRLVYCGETMPATQIATHLDRTEAASKR